MFGPRDSRDGPPCSGRSSTAAVSLASAMTRTPSVLVAMSGGVDSSVSAALLHERGFRVLGSHMRLVDSGGLEHGCCGPQAEADAAEVARVAGFDFEVADLGAAFERNGPLRLLRRAPCRPDAEPLRPLQPAHQVRGVPRARRRARVRLRRHRPLRPVVADRRRSLAPGSGTRRRQGPVLHAPRPGSASSSSRSLFPVGEQTKAETRAHAVRLGLPVAQKPDSQEVCFVPGADHARLPGSARARSGCAPARSWTRRAATSWASTAEHSATRSGSGAASASPRANARTSSTSITLPAASWSGPPSCWPAGAWWPTA